MSLVIEDLKVPIRVDEHGTARVGGTRVTLHTVIAEFRDGATPEQIVDDFDALKLADVYAVVAYYLQHQAQVDADLQEYERKGDEVRRDIEARFPRAGIRQRLLARRTKGEGVTRKHIYSE